MSFLNATTGAASSATTCLHQETAEECSEIHVGEWVEVYGLTSVRGQRLNGVIGEVITLWERVGVYIHEEEKAISLRHYNLTVVGNNCDSEPEWD